MDEALRKVGLPVRCGFGDCETTGFVKPHTDYGGWYKSRMYRTRPRKRWYCPEHAQDGQAWDQKFYEDHKTPEPEPVVENVEEELYKLLED